MSKNTEKHTSYTGDLAEPIMLKIISTINSQSDNALYLHQETERKLKLLHVHYDVPDTNTRSLEKLVLCMAKEHVPGFKVEYPQRTLPKKVGSPPRWAGKEGVLLYSDMHQILKSKKSVLGACKNLILNNKRYSADKPDSLRQRYIEICKRWGVEHCENMDVILEKLPKELSDNFLASYFPNGDALFNNKKLVSHMAKFFLNYS